LIDLERCPSRSNLNSIMVELIPGKKYGDKAESFIVSSIKKYMGDDVDVVVQVVNDLESPPSRKRRIVVSKVPVRME